MHSGIARMEKSRFIAVSAVCLFFGICASAQSLADSLRRAYDFPAAVEYLTDAIAAADSAEREPLEEELLLCQNGLGMMDFCSKPTVISKYRFSIEDFFLYYPLPDKSWRPVPNQLDSLGGDGPVKATFIPDGAKSLYYSAKDEVGVRNIYRTDFKDSVWTAPQLLNETVTSPEDEIFPMTSADGKSLYFASQGLYGMGGFDLYVSTWDEDLCDWSVPSNLGFPYSSPYDDFLLINTRDGKYTIFASNRDCPADSVNIYVLEQDISPVHKKIDDVENLRALASLTPKEDVSDAGLGTHSNPKESEEIRTYMEKLRRVKELRDSLSLYNAEIAGMRNLIATGEGEDKAALTTEILKKEMELPAKKATLDAAVKELQKVEMEFLMNGVVIDPERLRMQSEREIVGTESGYTFSRREMGAPIEMIIEEPVQVFDYSFKVLDEGQFAEDNTIPDGIVYQIQLFSLSREATVKDIKGLSPVFERSSNQKHIYSVGLFRSYSDVLKNLNTVKKAGFKNAMIVAFKDGKIINISTARSLESKIRTIYKVRIYPPDGQSLPDIAKTAVGQMAAGCDIVRVMDGGAVAFEVVPIDDRTSAEELMAAIKAAGISNCSVMEAGQTESK